MIILRFRFLYLILYGTFGSLGPFLGPYLHQLGFNDAQIGRISACGGMAMLVAPILYGHLADKHISPQKLMRWGLLLTAAVLTALWCVGAFWQVYILYLLYALVSSPLPPLLASMLFAQLQRMLIAGQVVPSYVSVRLWGSVGFVLPLFLLWGVFRYSDLPLEIVVPLAAVLSLIGWLCMRALPDTAVPEDAGRGHFPIRDALCAFGRADVRHFVIALFFLAVSSATIGSFQTRYLQELGVASQWIGLIVSLAVVVEVCFLSLAPVMFRLLGLNGVILFGMAGTVVRLVLLAGIPSIATALVAQLFHGPLVLALSIVPSVYVNRRIEEHFRTSTQAALAVLFSGVAALFGCLIGGYSTQLSPYGGLHGLQVTFLVAAIFALLAMLWFMLKVRFKRGETAY